MKIVRRTTTGLSRQNANGRTANFQAEAANLRQQLVQNGGKDSNTVLIDGYRIQLADLKEYFCTNFPEYNVDLSKNCRVTDSNIFVITLPKGMTITEKADTDAIYLTLRKGDGKLDRTKRWDEPPESDDQDEAPESAAGAEENPPGNPPA